MTSPCVIILRPTINTALEYFNSCYPVLTVKEVIIYGLTTHVIQLLLSHSRVKYKEKSNMMIQNTSPQMSVHIAATTQMVM